MKVLITGATGLIGSRIVKDCLEKEIKVSFLTTRKDKLDSLAGCEGFYWNPQKNIIDTNCFNEIDSIINLSGASIFRIWTKRNKELILNSRVQSLNFLREQLNAQSGMSLISPGFLVARFIASTGYELRQMLVPIINKMTDGNLPKTWRL